jgi:hypothetical protein
MNQLGTSDCWDESARNAASTSQPIQISSNGISSFPKNGATPTSNQMMAPNHQPLQFVYTTSNHKFK